MEQANYQKLKIWQRSFNLASDIYNVSRKFPQIELFGLTSQMQRAGVSVLSNIAEGYMRNSRKEFQRFLRIALGSLAELET